MLRELFSDKNGNLSSKRVAGMALVIAGVWAAFTGVDPTNVQWLLLSGVGALGVGTFETSINK